MHEDTMSDPQTSMCTVMKPPKGFEIWMQGQSAAIPIPLCPMEDDQVIITDTIPGTAGPNWDPLMLRYLPVPIGSTVLLWFPRVVEGTELTEVSYHYQLRWRLRSLQDRGASNRKKTYTLLGSLGANTAPSNTDPQFAVPACLGQVITPALPAGYNEGLALNFNGDLMSDSQGFYGRAIFMSTPNFPRGPIFYPPVLIPAVGDELAIYAYRDFISENGNSTWNFINPGTDDGFSIFYGVGEGASQHPWYPSHGVYVATQGRATFP
jgi:hypothetical protein